MIWKHLTEDEKQVLEMIGITPDKPLVLSNFQAIAKLVAMTSLHELRIHNLEKALKQKTSEAPPE